METFGIFLLIQIRVDFESPGSGFFLLGELAIFPSHLDAMSDREASTESFSNRLDSIIERRGFHDLSGG
jgi:hypothetical protein